MGQQSLKKKISEFLLLKLEIYEKKKTWILSAIIKSNICKGKNQKFTTKSHKCIRKKISETPRLKIHTLKKKKKTLRKTVEGTRLLHLCQVGSMSSHHR